MYSAFDAKLESRHNLTFTMLAPCLFQFFFRKDMADRDPEPDTYRDRMTVVEDFVWYQKAKWIMRSTHHNRRYEMELSFL